MKLIIIDLPAMGLCNTLQVSTMKGLDPPLRNPLHTGVQPLCIMAINVSAKIRYVCCIEFYT